MKWKTMQAIVWIYMAAYIPVFLLIVTLVGDGDLVKIGTVIGLTVAYAIGVLPLMHLKNSLWEKQIC